MGCRKDMQGDPTVVYEHIKDVLRDKRLYPELGGCKYNRFEEMRTGADITGLWSYGMPFPHLYIGGAERNPGTQSLGEVLEVTESPSVSEASPFMRLMAVRFWSRSKKRI